MARPRRKPQPEEKNIIVEDDRKSKKAKKTEESAVKEEEEEVFDLTEEEEEEGDNYNDADNHNHEPTELLNQTKKIKSTNSDSSFVGDPIPDNEARQRWPSRYNNSGAEEEVMQAKCHYSQAIVDGYVYGLGDDAYVQADEGNLDYIAKIIELFENTNHETYFKAQWFYRPQDTIIKELSGKVNQFENKRVFISEMKDDNPLDCLIRKVEIVEVQPNMDLDAKLKTIPPCDLYYDMKYLLPFHTFKSLKKDNSSSDSEGSVISSETGSKNNGSVEKSEVFLLDLYSGCGTMSTGLCIGANLAGVKLVTKWAVDINKHACKSVKVNHPETEVRNEAAEDFLLLLKEWEKLCQKFSLVASDNVQSESEDEQDADDDIDAGDDSEMNEEEFEVEKFLAICYGDPNKAKQRGLYLKVSWLGYGPSYDTWEPIEGLSNCKEKIKDFVTKGFKSNLLPLPGTVDFICGGPPCQGISGFNRFRNKLAPLEGPKNYQLIVFMNIIEYLQPKYVLMENVVDILRFAGGYLSRYAIGRLVSMNYQTRIGMMAAGSYGVPQFRMRVFLWAANPFRKLPQYPFPTHKVDGRGLGANAFDGIEVKYDKQQPSSLSEPILLGDILSDLPKVTNDDNDDEREYGTNYKTDFQKYIRLKKDDVVSFQDSKKPHMLYDHCPFHLNKNDHERVCSVPKKKGANFRDLPGVLVGPDNKVFIDKSIARPLTESGKKLVPDYAITYKNGKSTQPFARVWWDEIINTVVTRAQPHNRAIVHPNQDRVLTVRENARIQGFPDCYQLFGPIKERYIQVGNAVAIPVALGLGYAFGIAWQELSNDEPLITLPFKFPNCLDKNSH
ncbi:hypothetical protein ACFE04_013544 [Oxalis oulophora]